MIELRINREDRSPRHHPAVPDEYPFFGNEDDADYSDDELEYFGITLPKKRSGSPCPYNEQGEYVPRSQRR